MSEIKTGTSLTNYCHGQSTWGKLICLLFKIDLGGEKDQIIIIIKKKLLKQHLPHTPFSGLTSLQSHHLSSAGRTVGLQSVQSSASPSSSYLSLLKHGTFNRLQCFRINLLQDGFCMCCISCHEDLFQCGLFIDYTFFRKCGALHGLQCGYALQHGPFQGLQGNACSIMVLSTGCRGICTSIRGTSSPTFIRP